MARGPHRMQMGELKEINTRGEDISRSIFQMQFAPPSNVLLSLLEFLNNQVDALTSVTEIMTGGQPRSDTTATAAQIAQSEAVKLFTDIQKAYHLSLGQEFQCVIMMYSIFLDESEIMDVSGITPFQITRQDYLTNLTIMPVADPNVMDKQEIVRKAEFLLNLIKEDPFLGQDPNALMLGTINLLEAIAIEPKKIDTIAQIYQAAVQRSMQQQQIMQAQEQQDTCSWFARRSKTNA